MTDPAPIFIGGMFKSGTSLLRALLGQHPSIASGLETYWFDLDWTQRDSEAFERRIVTLAGLFEFPADEVFALAHASADVRVFLDAFMARFAAQEGKPRWAEKTPGNIAHAERILQLWPDARLIHIVRDPRDVYASLVEAGKWNDADAFSSRWCEMIGAAARLRESGCGAGRVLEIRYEALTLDPLSTMRTVIGFLDEPWDDAVARYSGRDTDYDRVLAVTGKASTTLERLKQPLSSERVRLWPRILSPEQIAAIHARARDAGLEAEMIRIEQETDALLGPVEHNNA